MTFRKLHNDDISRKKLQKVRIINKCAILVVLNYRTVLPGQFALLPPEWINKCGIHTIKYYSAFENNEVSHIL